MRLVSNRSLGCAALVCLCCWLMLVAASCSDDSTTSPKKTKTEIIELSDAAAGFSTEEGEADPALQVVSVTNAGPGTLSDLSAAVSYGSGQPTGWLSAILAETTAPTEITLQATTGGGALGAGTYSATVAVASSKANNSPQNLAVTFSVLARYGFFNEFAQISGHDSNFLLGSRITVPAASTLTHLCLIAKGAGPQVKIGLYTDVGGEPGQLIASTLATTLVAGRLEIPVAETALAAGDYWFMAVYNTTASIGFNTANAAAVVKYTAHSFATPLPATFPTPMTYSGQEFNYYIKARVP